MNWVRFFKTHFMIHESEVIHLLGAEMPSIGLELQQPENAKNVYKTVHCFAAITKGLLGTGNYQAVKKCVVLAEDLFEKGNTTVKVAIENVFLYTLVPLIDKGDEASMILKSMLTGSLLKEYERQVSTSCL